MKDGFYWFREKGKEEFGWEVVEVSNGSILRAGTDEPYYVGDTEGEFRGPLLDPDKTDLYEPMD